MLQILLLGKYLFEWREKVKRQESQEAHQKKYLQQYG